MQGKVGGPQSSLENKHSHMSSVREKQRRGENSGGGKTYHKSPPQKRFWTPPLMIRFPPPFVHAMSFSLEEMGTDQTNPTFWGLQNWFCRGCFMVRFPPPPPPKSHDTFCPPLCEFPTLNSPSFLENRMGGFRKGALTTHAPLLGG